MTITPAPATKKAARGLHCGRDQTAEDVADARRRRGGAIRACPSTRACIPGEVSSCTALTTATHWMPLPAPPMAEATQAIGEGRGDGHAKVAGADRDRAEEEQHAAAGRVAGWRRRRCRAPSRRPSCRAAGRSPRRLPPASPWRRSPRSGSTTEKKTSAPACAASRRRSVGIAADVAEPGAHPLPQAVLRLRLGLGQRLRCRARCRRSRRRRPRPAAAPTGRRRPRPRRRPAPGRPRRRR